MSRGKGEGTIVQRQDGTWMAQISLGYMTSSAGVRNRIRKTVYGATKPEVRKKMEEVRKDAGLGLSDEKLMVSDYLDRWLVDTVKRTTKPKTLISYKHTVANYLRPFLATVPLKTLTLAHVKAWVTTLEEAGKPLPSIRYAWSVLKIALNAAVEDKLIAGNPITQKTKAPKAPKRKMTPWTAEEAMVFLRYLDTASQDSTNPNRYNVARIRALFYVAIYAGLRHGELLALKWSDIDNKKFVVHVDESLNQYTKEEGGAKLETTKSSQARDVDVSPVVLAVLKAHRATYSADLLKSGFSSSSETGATTNKKSETHDLVFKTKNGRSYSQSNIRRVFHALSARAGVPIVRIHDLRHTHATLWLENGATLKEVQERLGHATPTITLVNYGHVSAERKKISATRLDGLLGTVA